MLSRASGGKLGFIFCSGIPSFPSGVFKLLLIITFVGVFFVVYFSFADCGMGRGVEFGKEKQAGGRVARVSAAAA